MKIIEKNLFTLCMPFSSSLIIKHKVHTLRCFVFNFFNCSGKGASFHWLNTTSNHCIYSKKHRPRFKTNNRLQGWYYVKDISSHQNDKNRCSRTVQQCKKASPLACHARGFTCFAFLPMHFQGKESLLVAYQSVSQHHHCFEEPCQEHCHKAGSSLFQAFSWSLVRKTAPERFKKSLPLAALFFIFSYAIFRSAPWLTERLEEAKLAEQIWLRQGAEGAMDSIRSHFPGFHSKQKLSSTVRLIVPKSLNRRSFRRIRYNLIKMWDLKLTNFYKYRY